MHIGFIGLGKMGGNMALRLAVGSPDGVVKGGHSVTGYATDPNPDLANVPGVKVVGTLDAMLAELESPRVVWVMIPAGAATESVITEMHEKLGAGGGGVDGGNSYYKGSERWSGAGAGGRRGVRRWKEGGGRGGG